MRNLSILIDYKVSHDFKNPRKIPAKHKFTETQFDLVPDPHGIEMIHKIAIDTWDPKSEILSLAADETSEEGHAF